MKVRLTSFALALVLLGALLMLRGNAVAQTNPFLDIPVTGTFAGGTFAGTLDITRFAVQNGQLVARGTLTGTLTGVGSVTHEPVAILVDPSVSFPLNLSGWTIWKVGSKPTSAILVRLSTLRGAL